MAVSTIFISPTQLRHDLSDQQSSNSSSSSIPLVISVLASLIERTLLRNERISKTSTFSLSENSGRLQRRRQKRIKVFDGQETPDMTIQSYLERIYKYTRAGSSVYVVAYVYIDRLCELYPDFRIDSRNVHRLLITTILVSSKYVEDMNYRNSYFARVGGLTTKEMNSLEMEFLFMMDFKVHVNKSVYEGYCCHLEREVSIGGGYQIERTLRCAQEIKSKQGLQETTMRYNTSRQITRVLL